MVYLVLMTLILTFHTGDVQKSKYYTYYRSMEACNNNLNAARQDLRQQPNVVINSYSCEETTYREGDVPN